MGRALANRSVEIRGRVGWKAVTPQNPSPQSKTCRHPEAPSRTRERLGVRREGLGPPRRFATSRRNADGVSVGGGATWQSGVALRLPRALHRGATLDCGYWAISLPKFRRFPEIPRPRRGASLFGCGLASARQCQVGLYESPHETRVIGADPQVCLSRDRLAGSLAPPI